MRILGLIIVAALALSVLQSLLAAAVVIGAILLLYGIVTQPREMTGFFAFSLFAWALQTHLMVMVAIGGVLLLIGLIFGRA